MTLETSKYIYSELQMYHLMNSVMLTIQCTWVYLPPQNNKERADLLATYSPGDPTSHPAVTLILDEYFTTINKGPTYTCAICNKNFYEF